MGMSWTREQEQVIRLQNRNILVSAAAGSGKTAVLVERIITKITDAAHPVDIDRLLIVTFTNAAAGEMKERIRAAIERKLEENPEDAHLKRQLTLVHHAQITTIHSFCLHVIKNYFHTIDLDPNFRIGDEGEMKLLRNDVAEEVLEEFYREICREEAEEEKKQRYRKFVDSYAAGKEDGELIDQMLSLYEFSMSDPWPLKWLRECLGAYEVKDLKEFSAAPWMRRLEENVRLLLKDCEESIRQARALCGQAGGPYMYEEALDEDLLFLAKMQKARGYLELADGFGNMKAWARLSSKKDEAVLEEKKEQVKEIREQMKKNLKGIQEQYFYDTPERMLEDMQACREQMGVLIELVSSFSVKFEEEKRKKNLLDFHDLEHLALQILVEEKEGEVCPTEAARRFSDAFEEVMIDEYQDSNLVQEYIVTSVSGKSRGVCNLFMVGDVKQSIYRFRQARPDLFMEKYDSYTTEDSLNQKVELHMNFRSRPQVLAGVNGIFRKIMTKNLGNITYDAAAALYPGAQFPPGGCEEGLDTEVLLLDLGSEMEVAEESGETSVELEARMVGKRIQELVGHMPVLDKKTGKYRPAKYCDIVILLRTMSGWDKPFQKTLEAMGIPAYTGSRTGYFSAVEVQTVMALLKVVDNPEQEIPFAAVLHSPIVGLTDMQMAKIRSFCPDASYPEACRQYRRIGEEKELVEKLERFFTLLEDFRSRVPYTPMHELLWYMLDETGYANYAAAMPGGEQRKANLDMLAEKAMAYESTSYRGLFNFIRYIGQLKKYEVDYGEASILGEEEDTVRIMSIHKSKGLEFPIVFAAGLNKNFNKQDSRGKTAMHPEYGIGCDWTDPILRVKEPTLLKKVIQRQLIYESLGEELRVLYVALTRAKEKLILTGTVKLEASGKKWNRGTPAAETLSFTTLSGASSYLDWIMPALAASEEKEAVYSVHVHTVEDLAIEEAGRQIKNRWTEEILRAWNTDKVYSSSMDRHLKEAFDARYPWESSRKLHGKVTVSELKSRSQAEEMETGYALFEEADVVPLIPEFVQEKQRIKGAAKGTVYHKFLEHLDYRFAETAEDVEKQLRQMCADGKFTKKEEDAIRISDMVQFVKSSLGQRMKRAALAGELFREQPFVLGVGANEIYPEVSGDDLVLVQGMIDAYFYEGDEIVLVDYKTDYVPAGQGQMLADKYGVQLKSYARALERMLGKRVKEQYIYSFWMQKGWKIEAGIGGEQE